LRVPVSTWNWSETATDQVPCVLAPSKRDRLPTGSGGGKPARVVQGELNTGSQDFV